MNNSVHKPLLMHLIALLCAFLFVYTGIVYLKIAILFVGILFIPVSMPYLALAAIVHDVLFMGSNMVPVYSIAAGILILIRLYIKKFIR